MFVRPFNPEIHAQKLLEWFSDTDTMHYMGLDVMDVTAFNEWLADETRIILVALDEDEVVGMINLYHAKTEFPDFELGYLIDPLYRGVGLGSLMLELSLNYIKRFHPEIKKISQTYVEGFNLASRRLLEKAGFDLERYDEKKDRYYYRLVLA